jgi:type IV pilus assembly protein PilC
MFWNSNTFYDKYWNFDNSKFLELLSKSKKSIQNKKKWWGINLNTEITLFNSVSKKEVWEFMNKLSIFINSWIDIKWAFNIIVKQIKNPYLKKIWNEIRTNIDYWISISETMKQYPKVFDNLTVALINVWEKTWNLGKVLNELDKKMLESIELKWKVKWALLYPAILLTLTFWVLVFMMMVIVPKITSAFTETGTELPYLTQLVVWMSNFMIEKWYIVFWAVVWFIILLKLLRLTHFWSLLLWWIAVRMPIFWYVVKQSNIVYFINSFTLLLDSWVLLLDALKTSSWVMTNIHYRREIIRIKNEIESGLTMSKALWLNNEYETNVYLNKYFPEEFAYIVNTWEETGTMSESLKKIGSNYNNELKRYIWNLSTMLEPFIIVLVWFMVGSIVIAIMLPFFEMWKIAKKL